MTLVKNRIASHLMKRKMTKKIYQQIKVMKLMMLIILKLITLSKITRKKLLLKLNHQKTT